jgi:hypothetical protein
VDREDSAERGSRSPLSVRSTLCSLCLCVLVVLIGAAAGCSGKKKEQTRKPDLKRQASELLKERAPSTTVRVTQGRWRVEDELGQPVLAARTPEVEAQIQPEDPSQGPVTLKGADLTLYEEGKPSLWLKAPVATWQAGILRAEKGARSGTVDRKLTLQGQAATWTARTGLLRLARARCELRTPSQPTLAATGETATWQNGLLTLPTGAQARAADGSSSTRADQIRWRPATHGLEATGRVRMTRGQLAGSGGRLVGDTHLRRFRLTGGRPEIVIYPGAAPQVVAGRAGAEPPAYTVRTPPEGGLPAKALMSSGSGSREVGGRGYWMWMPRPSLFLAVLGAGLAALPLQAAPAETRP